jgi:hypothetical protein
LAQKIMKLVSDFSKIMLYIMVPRLKLFEPWWTHFGAYFLVEALISIIISRYWSPELHIYASEALPGP